ncbi:hypothetical protein BKA70DRAFT_1225461 [Coprinopsis sp. MPI-PUGE-AT-0042]|nr:hypothetical protein BKA70DRAFT_1225461 [Coprinopsis sp. MPI-PUGE-AT-0042]
MRNKFIGDGVDRRHAGLNESKRLAEKAENVNAKKGGYTDSASTVLSTRVVTLKSPLPSPASCLDDSDKTERVAGTPFGSTPLGGSKNVSQENIVMSIAKLNLATDRRAAGVLVKGRVIKIDAFALSLHGRLLIKGAEASLNYGNRYGLLGENGSGKINAVDVNITSACGKVAKLEAYIEKLSVQEDVDKIAMDTAYEQLEELDPATFEAKAASILDGLGFSQEMMARSTKDMNGGWRIRVALASHILIVTSHSQDFMDTVCAHIMDLFIASGGTYANPVQQAKSKQKIIDKMEAAGLIERYLSCAPTSTIPPPASRLRSCPLLKPWTALLSDLYISFDDLIEIPKPLNFQFEDISKLPPPIIAFDDVAFSYSGQKKGYLYQGLSFGIVMDSRIATLGANGTGKSTLLHNLITGALQPCEGTVSKHVM